MYKNYRVCGHFGLKNSSHCTSSLVLLAFQLTSLHSWNLHVYVLLTSKLCDAYLSIETNERTDKSQKGITPI